MSTVVETVEERDVGSSGRKRVRRRHKVRTPSSRRSSRDDGDDHDLRSAVAGVAGGSPVPQSEAEFLRDMVKRLNVELGRYHARDPDSVGTLSPAATDPLADDDPLPPWLVDSSYLSPLVVAYDRRIADLERDLSARDDAVTELSLRADAVVEENERLHTELKEAYAVLSSAARDNPLPVGVAAAPGVSAEEWDETQERLRLLTEENDVVTRHNVALAADLDRIRHDNATLTDDYLRLKSHVEELQERVRTGTATTPAATTVGGGGSGNGFDGAGRRFATPVRVPVAVGSCEACARREGEAAEYKAVVEALQGQVKAAGRAREEDGEARRAAELDLRRLEEQVRSLTATNGLLEKGKASLGSERDDAHARLAFLEERLRAAEAREAEATGRVRDAMALADEAAGAKEQVLLREAVLEREVERLTAQLAAWDASLGQRQEAWLAAQEARLVDREAEWRAQLETLDHERARAKEGEARALRSLREAEAELRQVQDTHRGSALVDQIARLDARLDALTAERDDARYAAAEARTAAQAAAAEVERVEADASARERLGRQRVSQLQDEAKAAHKARVEAVAALGQAEAEIHRLSMAKDEGEAAAARLLADICAERDADLAALEAKVEHAVGVRKVMSAELDRLAHARSDVSSAWKEESMKVAAQYDAVVRELRTDNALLLSQNQELGTRLAKALEETTGLGRSGRAVYVGGRV